MVEVYLVLLETPVVVAKVAMLKVVVSTEPATLLDVMLDSIVIPVRVVVTSTISITGRVVVIGGVQVVPEKRTP